MGMPGSGGSMLPEKPDLGRRLLAALIDGGIGFLISLVPVIGGLVAAAYMLVRDGLEVEFMKHQSVGKKLMNLQAVHQNGQPLDIATSVKRNLPLAVSYLGAAFFLIPFIGWLIAIPLVVIGMILGVAEIVLVLTDPQGRRLGDKLAATKVIEVAGQIPSSTG